MTGISHEPVVRAREPWSWVDLLKIREMWASLAICAMWLAVVIDAVWGPDFVSTSGTSMTKIPTAIIVALFAFLGTSVVAKYGFRHEEK
jgi:hypothetical protein